MWIAFAAQAGGHAAIADALPALGIKWVAPRGGAGGFRDASWSRWTARDSVKHYHDAGLAVYPWLFSRPWSWQNEIALFQQFIDEGADGIIIDAETPWDRAQRDRAARYMAALDKALPDVWIADAPWAYPSYHPDFPFVEFGQRMNARLPQAYWTEFDNQGARHHLPLIDAQWAALHAKHPGIARPVCPIGVVYGHEHPSRPPGVLTLDDVAFFLDRYEGSPVSLYTYEAALYADKTIHPGTLDMLRDRATPTTPPPPDDACPLPEAA